MKDNHCVKNQQGGASLSKLTINRPLEQVFANKGCAQRRDVYNAPLASGQPLKR
ncbi:MAG: hypothetical protein ACI88A_003251 [Paraglaciecola sp.]|jgi:hypothetical protein